MRHAQDRDADGELPLVVLGGSDGRPARLPAAGRDKHPLTGYKGVDIRIEGKPLVDRIVERFASAGGYGPFYVAGPAAAYGERRDGAAVVDTDAGFGANIRAAIEAVAPRHPGAHVGFTTCDILPEIATLRELRARLGEAMPCDLWFPLIRTPEDERLLGASRWKPAYRICLREGEAPVRILPGHLVAVDPAALRLQFLYRLFQLGYETRNRSIAHRRAVMVRGVLATLVGQDLREIAALRAPVVTWSVLYHGIRAAGRLKAGSATRELLEDTVRRLFVTRRHRRRHPTRRAVLPVVAGLSLARDIDTLEEAREFGAEIAGA